MPSPHWAFPSSRARLAGGCSQNARYAVGTWSEVSATLKARNFSVVRERPPAGLVRAILWVLSISLSTEAAEVRRQVADELLGFFPELLGAQEVAAETFAQTRRAHRLGKRGNAYCLPTQIRNPARKSRRVTTSAPANRRSRGPARALRRALRVNRGVVVCKATRGSARTTISQIFARTRV